LDYHLHQNNLFSRYKLLNKVGSGAYGFVVAADDVLTGKKVAIKKVANAFEDMVDAKRMLREVRLMRQFNHPNVVKLYDIMEPPYIEGFEDLYIVTELMSTDLQKILYSKTKLTGEQMQYLVYQLLAGMNYINSSSVLHRDLKPSNLLIDIQTCNLQICDFGLARGTTGQQGAIDDNTITKSDNEVDGVLSQEYTEYVVTRWYRAPEIMLGFHAYDQAIDMWSIGCIFGEMLLLQPIFPGNDYIHQLKLIVKLLGRPRKADLWFVSNQNAMNFMLQLPDYKSQNFQIKFPKVEDDDALNLLARMLVFNPKGRISLRGALKHKYVEDFREYELEQDAGFHVKVDDIEATKLNKACLQKMLYNEIRAFHRKVPPDHGGEDGTYF
jgi:mitogen-activated protein kinase 1/3